METIGIDLGNAYCKVAWLKAAGDALIIANRDNDRLTPTVLAIHQDGSFLVGRTANEIAALHPASVAAGAVARLANDDPVVLAKQTFSATELVGRLLQHLKADAEMRLSDTISRACIAVPPTWNQTVRDRLRAAADVAHLTVDVIESPIAALLASELSLSTGRRQNFLVYDFGSTAFTATLLSVEDGTLDIVSVGTLPDVGSEVFDRLLIEYVCVLIQQEHNVDPSNDNSFMVELRRQVQRAKIGLDTDNRADVVVFGGLRNSGGTPTDVLVEIERDEFERLIEDRVQATIDLSRSIVSATDLDAVLLVGGSTRIPLVQDSVRRAFGDRLIADTVDPIECVARGSALFAGGTDLHFREKFTALSTGVGNAVPDNAPSATEETITVPSVTEEVAAAPSVTDETAAEEADSTLGNTPSQPYEDDDSEIDEADDAIEVMPEEGDDDISYPMGPVAMNEDASNEDGFEETMGIAIGMVDHVIDSDGNSLHAATEPPIELDNVDHAATERPIELDNVDPVDLVPSGLAVVQGHDEAGSSAQHTPEPGPEPLLPADSDSASPPDDTPAFHLNWMVVEEVKRLRAFTYPAFLRIDTQVFHLSTVPTVTGPFVDAGHFYLSSSAPESLPLTLSVQSGQEDVEMEMTFPLPQDLPLGASIGISLGVEEETGTPYVTLQWHDSITEEPHIASCREWRAKPVVPIVEAPPDVPLILEVEPTPPIMEAPPDAPLILDAEPAAPIVEAPPDASLIQDTEPVVPIVEALPDTPLIQDAEPAVHTAAVLNDGQGRYGRYEPLDMLESSANSRTYRSREPNDGRPVLLKIYAADDDAARQRFFGALLPIHMAHPNVVRIHDFGTTGDDVYIVTEHLESNLRDITGSRIERQPMQIEQALLLVDQICRGLEAIHARSIFHRNLKPINVLLDAEGQLAKLAGFEHAISLRGREAATDVVGTLPYMAPEVLDRRSDCRADVYALGVILYELSTGKLPFWATSQRLLVDQIKNQPLTEPRSINPLVSKYLNDAILCALERDISRRFQSAAELREALMLEPGTVYHTVTSPIERR